MSTGVLPPNCNTIRIRDCSYQVLLNLYMHVHVFAGNNINSFFYRDMEWTGNYITDFSKLLPQLRSDDFTYDEVWFHTDLEHI